MLRVITCLVVGFQLAAQQLEVPKDEAALAAAMPAIAEKLVAAARRSRMNTTARMPRR